MGIGLTQKRELRAMRRRERAAWTRHVARFYRAEAAAEMADGLMRGEDQGAVVLGRHYSPELDEICGGDCGAPPHTDKWLTSVKAEIVDALDRVSIARLLELRRVVRGAAQSRSEREIALLRAIVAMDAASPDLLRESRAAIAALYLEREANTVRAAAVDAMDRVLARISGSIAR